VKFLLDTDHLSILQRRSGSEFVALARRIARQSPADLGLSVVSFHEQVLGCHGYINRARQQADVIRGYAMLERTLRSLSEVPLVPFDAGASGWFDQLVGRRQRVATMDLRIAATAISRGMTLMTRNAGDFAKIEGLVTEDWTG